MFCRVIRFMCGQRLQGRTNSVLGRSQATLSAMEHSVISTTCPACAADIVDHRRRRAGEVGHFEHLGRAFGVGEDLGAGIGGRVARGYPAPLKRS